MQITCYFNYCDREPEIITLETSDGNIMIGMGDCTMDGDTIKSDDASVFGDVTADYETEYLASLDITDVQDDMEFGVSYGEIVLSDDAGTLTVTINDDGCGNRNIKTDYQAARTVPNALTADKDAEGTKPETDSVNNEYPKLGEDVNDPSDSFNIPVYIPAGGNVIVLPECSSSFDAESENNGYSIKDFTPAEQEELLDLADAVSQSPSIAEKTAQYEKAHEQTKTVVKSQDRDDL